MLQVDSFSPVPFGGNPAAVCLLPESIDPTVMQRIGAEMNLSETAFVEKASRGSTSTNPFTDDAHFNLRWFTPRKEADMCGHATLAAAATLFQGDFISISKPCDYCYSHCGTQLMKHACLLLQRVISRKTCILRP